MSERITSRDLSERLTSMQVLLDSIAANTDERLRGLESTATLLSDAQHETNGHFARLDEEISNLDEEVSNTQTSLTGVTDQVTAATVRCTDIGSAFRQTQTYVHALQQELTSQAASNSALFGGIQESLTEIGHPLQISAVDSVPENAVLHDPNVFIAELSALVPPNHPLTYEEIGAAIHERRLRRVELEPGVLVSLLLRPQDQRDLFCDAPPNCILVNVLKRHNTATVLITIAHPSFSSLMPAAEIPIHAFAYTQAPYLPPDIPEMPSRIITWSTFHEH